MKRFVLVPLAMLCLLASPAMADDPKPVDAGVVDAGAQPVDPVDEAGKVVDDAIKEIDKDNWHPLRYMDVLE